MKVRVNIGCGRTPTDGWVNMDNSPAIKLANAPIRYRLAKTFKLLNQDQIENIEWNRQNKITFADATKSIPLEENSAECIYTSHMIEHLPREGVLKFLSEALRVLDDDGVIRIAVPDLRIAVDSYLASENADDFMSDILVQAPPINTLRQKISLFMSGYRHHLWMYDGRSLCRLLESCGFQNVQVCADGYTQISNPNGLNLHEREDKSVYVEGVK